MIVKLHDGTEGELVGWVAHEALAMPGPWVPEIVVLSAHRGQPDVLERLWRGNSYLEPYQARYALDRAVQLAGLCFLDDDRNLDLSPWVCGGEERHRCGKGRG